MQVAAAVPEPHLVAQKPAGTIAKRIAHVVGLLRCTPHLARYVLAQYLIGQPRAFCGVSEGVARIPGYSGIYTRQALYKLLLAGVGRDVYFGFMSVFSKPDAIIGNRVYIGRFCTIGRANIGDEVMIADSVQILSGRHQHGDAAPAKGTMHENPKQYTKVTIGSGAWIGAGAIVMADVGDHAIVGAGAVVVDAVQRGTKVGGVPARLLTDAGEGEAVLGSCR